MLSVLKGIKQDNFHSIKSLTVFSNNWLHVEDNYSDIADRESIG